MTLPLWLLKRRFRQSFQCKIMLLLLILLVPIFIIQAYVYQDRYRTRLSEELQSNLELARAVAATFETFLQDVLHQEALIGFALTSLPMNQDEQNAILALSIKEYPPVLGFGWTGPQGVLAASTVPDMIGMDLGHRRYIQEIISGNRDWSVSELLLAIKNKTPAFAIARAIRGQNAELLGIVVTAVRADRLDSVFGIKRSGEADVSIVDKKGMLVFRHPALKLSWNERNWIGKRPELSRTLTGEELAYVGESVFGDRRIVATVPIRTIGWLAGTTRLEEEAMARTRSALLPQALLFLSLTLLAVAAAFLFSRRICNSLHELRDYVGSLGDAPPPRPSSSSEAAEIREVREAFDEMTEKLRSRDSALRESEKQLRLFIEHAPVALAMFDKEMNYLSASRLWLRDLVPEGGDPSGLSFYKTFPCMPEHWKLAYRRALAGEVVKADEDCFKGAKGASHWLRWEVRPWRKGGEIAGVIIFSEDISERREAEKKLRASEEQFRTLVENAPDAIFIQTEGLFAYVNEATLRLYGAKSAEELIGKHLLERVHPDCRSYVLERVCNAVEQKKPAIISEQKHLRMDGETISVEAHSAPIDYLERPGALVFARDITERERAREERQQLQERLQQALKAESLGRMAGGIAHHFNNMLGAAMGYLELVLCELPEGSPYRANIIESISASQRAAEICKLMLSYLGQTSGKRESLEFQKICSEAITLIAASLPVGIELQWELPTQPLVVNVNASDVKQVLTNLIMNAGEAIGDAEGTITVEAGVKTMEEIAGSMFFPPDWSPQAKEYVWLSVLDTGCGLDSTTLNRIFDPFFSTKFTGRGLGLSTALGLMRSHEGGITVESQPGIGSKFTVFLPLPERETSLVKTISAIVPAESEGLVLLAEDEPMVRNMARAMLNRLGYEVLAASDGLEALETFNQKKDEVCLAFLDVSMPRMDGWELMASLRKMRPDIPVILSSGHSEMHLMKVGRSERPQGFIYKPYRLQELRSVLLAVLNAEHDCSTVPGRRRP